jgi:hypothetical protein
VIASSQAVALESAAGKAPEALVAAVVQVLSLGADPLRGAFITRSLNSLARLARGLDAGTLGQAVSLPSDYEALVCALSSPGALEALRQQDPLLAARLRGLRAREALLSGEGGAFTSAQAAEALGITRQAVEKRRHAGKLLAVNIGRRGYLYPSWQFTPEGVLPGIEQVLIALSDHDPWMRLAFMLNANTALGGQTPLDELQRRNVEPVLRAARLYGEQGAV